MKTRDIELTLTERAVVMGDPPPSIDQLWARWIRTGNCRDLMAYSDAVGAEAKRLVKQAEEIMGRR